MPNSGAGERLRKGTRGGRGMLLVLIHLLPRPEKPLFCLQNIKYSTYMSILSIQFFLFKCDIFPKQSLEQM